MSGRNFALGIVTNPYATVCLIALNDDGKIAWRTVKAWTGGWNKDGEPVYKGTKKVVDTINPHESAGMFSASSVGILDATPRSFAEAMQIAGQCPRGNHIEYLTNDKAKAAIESAIQEITAKTM